MIAAFLISFVLIALTIAIHYEALRLTSSWVVDLPVYPRARIIVVLAVGMISHCIHVLIYAVAFMWMIEQGDFGTIGGIETLTFADAFYFSITSYTTLGIGDLFPEGAIRLVSGIEALNGLVLVGWTASFTYLKMERYWRVPEETARDEVGSVKDD
ncbi:potassium channel family protein [Parerythrobacter jejuensis]|uniref:Two pore domain potassium channel family protein n=1 Tax=Parerythrobacter jejuensis TaxID=795812 RepID=A0A845AKY9_9SPHN|nr:potassium channel family protein [Parerythrobacter jejuensis]MXP31422.1 two pore domain potassium channel family protein [Parerythrobacter jejuensis]